MLVKSVPDIRLPLKQKINWRCFQIVCFLSHLKSLSLSEYALNFLYSEPVSLSSSNSLISPPVLVLNDLVPFTNGFLLEIRIRRGNGQGLAPSLNGIYNVQCKGKTKLQSENWQSTFFVLDGLYSEVSVEYPLSCRTLVIDPTSCSTDSEEEFGSLDSGESSIL